MIKSERVFKEFPDKICLAYTPSYFFLTLSSYDSVFHDFENYSATNIAFYSYLAKYFL